MSEQIKYKVINAFPKGSFRRLPDYVIFSKGWELEIILCSFSVDVYKIFYRKMFEIPDDNSKDFDITRMKPFRLKMNSVISIYPTISSFFLKNIDIIQEEYIWNKAGNAIGPYYKIKVNDVVNELLPRMIHVEEFDL